MVAKKSKKADLEPKRNIFALVGLVLALGFTLLAFDWKTKVKEVESLGSVVAPDVEEEYIPITREDQVVEDTPPPAPIIPEVLNIVSNDTKVDMELDMGSTEANDETIIPVTTVIEQPAEEEAEDNNVFYAPEEMPEFPGGNVGLVDYIQRTLKYPVIAQENGISGTVVVTFVVNKDGSVSDAKVLRGISDSLNDEALRVVNSLPKWKPGMQGGRPVRVQYSVPITFRLE